MLKFINLIFCLGFVLSVCSAQTNDEQLVLVQVPGIGMNERVSDIQIVGDEVWIASKKGVSKVLLGQEETTSILSKGEAISIKVASDGSMLTGFSNNTIYIDDFQVFKIDSDTVHITDIEEYNGKMYVGSTEGVFIFDLKRRSLESTMDTKNSKLGSNIINFVFADSNDRLWIGTDKGVMYKKGADKNWTQNYDNNLDYIAITENEEGVWLISDKKMWLVNSTDNQWIDAGLNKGLHVGDINDLVVDNDGNILIASDVLVKFNPYKNTTFKYTDVLGIASKKCLALACDSDNVIWLGTDDAGLFQITTGEVEFSNLTISSILESTISCPGANDATIGISVQGGTPPYDYFWNPVRLKGQNPGLLKAGDYALTITDSKGASKQITFTITEPEPIDIQVANSEKASGATKRDGMVEVTISGGSSPYQILWDNGEKGTQASKLNYGFHYLTITDANGCSAVEKVSVQKQASMASLKTTNLKVGSKLRLDNLYFQADSSTIQSNSLESLEEIFDFLQENNNIVIEIGGHTNGVPPHEYCDKLSEARSKTVAEYLIGRGIEVERVKYKGYGKREPIATNDTASGRKRNQRVEMKILEIKEDSK